MCPSFEDNIPTVATRDQSMVFTGLEEFSYYTVMVTAIFDVSGVLRLTEMTFTTLSAGIVLAMHTNLIDSKHFIYILNTLYSLTNTSIGQALMAYIPQAIVMRL